MDRSIGLCIQLVLRNSAAPRAEQPALRTQKKQEMQIQTLSPPAVCFCSSLTPPIQTGEAEDSMFVFRFGEQAHTKKKPQKRHRKVQEF